MMSYTENSEFIKDLQEVIKKHGLMIMYSKNTEKLVEDTKHLEGYHMFFTKGEKLPILRHGEHAEYPNTLTIKFSKSRNTEDDGN